MKLTISMDELSRFAKTCNEEINESNYWEMTTYYLINIFPEWDFDMAFNAKTFDIDFINKEVSLEMRRYL